MILLPYSQPCRRQPQIAVALSRGGVAPFLQWSGAHPSIGMDGYAWTRSASLADSEGPVGKTVTFTGNTTNAFTRSGVSTAAQTRFFALSVFRWDSGGANNFPQLLGASTGNSSFRVGSTSINGGDLGLVKGDVVALSTVSIASGTWYAMVCSHRQDTGEYYLVARPIAGLTMLRATGTNTAASTAGNGTAGVGISRTDFNGAWNGAIALAVAAFDWVPEGEARQYLDNPWSIFEPQRIWVPVSAGGGINASVTLTGCSAASAAGTTVALGSATVTLSGASSASAAGSLLATAGATAVLSGTSSASAAGAVAASAGASVTVVGSAASSAAGALTATAGGNAVATLTGASATSTAGSLTAGGSAGISLAGVGAAGAAGAVTATAGGAASVTLTGASASAAAGILAGFGGAQITLTGASASGAAGSASASAGSGSGTGATAAEIWSYTLSSGLTAEATLVAIHTMLSELHLIHGLTAGSPLSVTVASRAAGAVSQAVAEAAGTVTVTRQ